MYEKPYDGEGGGQKKRQKTTKKRCRSKDARKSAIFDDFWLFLALRGCPMAFRGGPGKTLKTGFFQKRRKSPKKSILEK